MLCVGVDNLLHVDKAIEDLRVASIFEIAILPRPSDIVLVDCCSQLQEIIKARQSFAKCSGDKNITAVAAKQTATLGASRPKTSGKTGPRAEGPV